MTLPADAPLRPSARASVRPPIWYGRRTPSAVVGLPCASVPDRRVAIRPRSRGDRSPPRPWIPLSRWRRRLRPRDDTQLRYRMIWSGGVSTRNRDLVDAPRTETGGDAPLADRVLRRRRDRAHLSPPYVSMCRGPRSGSGPRCAPNGRAGRLLLDLFDGLLPRTDADPHVPADQTASTPVARPRRSRFDAATTAENRSRPAQREATARRSGSNSGDDRAAFAVSVSRSRWLSTRFQYASFSRRLQVERLRRAVPVRFRPGRYGRPPPPKQDRRQRNQDHVAAGISPRPVPVGFSLTVGQFAVPTWSHPCRVRPTARRCRRRRGSGRSRRRTSRRAIGSRVREGRRVPG